MIRILKLGEIDRDQILCRSIGSYPEFEKSVSEILATVEKEGDAALYAYAARFDKVELSSLTVSREEIDEAFAKVDPAYIDILKKAAANISEYHAKQKREGFEMRREGGVILGQKITPIEKAGLYVPGGTASYPSTVLMNAIPAKIAGVKEVVMTTPPGKDGKIRAEVLVAASLCGVDKIIKSGGAQAIGALAFGTESVPKVDKIVGPGNIFVALAKKAVFGRVNIDMIAGPSEILVLADDSANPTYVAADLLSQAEHDKLATAVLVTDSETLAVAVQAELERQLALLERSEIARTSIEQNGKIILVGSIDEAVEVSNLIAPEHLELAVNDPMALLPKIENAGSIFMGHYTPEPMGDYFAGPNHTLPTGGSARFSSPLSVDDFIKKTQYLYYTPAELEKAYQDVAVFARSEGLTAHARAVEVRFEEAQE
ncbi:MAG: histidinol dehydrogenase [Clostridia bacterium]|nr:histidinol dehydrogenase [Clostridia bacterium]